MTNWAYGITVGLTIASGMAMLIASGADRAERQAVQQRDTFVRLVDEIERDAWELSDLVRLYVIEKQPETLQQYRQQVQTLESIENRLLKLKDVGASQQELALLRDGLRIADELQDEQQTAIDRVARGEEKEAIDHFRLLLEGRTNNAMQQATEKSRLWRTLSEAMVGLTALMFLFVLGFILKRRVLTPVVRLSDVVQRLASQDYAVEPPHFKQIDEIGDMAQAIRIFRENGLARQRLEQQRDADWAVRELLARMTQRLQGCESFEDVVKVAELFAPNIAPDVPGRLYILDTDPWQMRCVAQWLSPPDEAAVFYPDKCWAVRRGLSHPPVNGEPDIACYHLPQECNEQSLCVPLIAQGEAIGLLSFRNVTSETAPSRAYLELMAEALGLALSNQRLRNALLEKALFDSLTGLRNRHHLEEALHTQMNLAVHNSPLSCLMIDIDHFKAVNDNYGHEAGDLVIKNVAAIIQRAVRDLGMAFRYGGEEFLVLLSGSDEASAEACATEIYNNVRNMTLRSGLTDIGQVNVSIGIASYPQHAQSDSLLRAADAALYRAKELGRSRIIRFDMLKSA